MEKVKTIVYQPDVFEVNLPFWTGPLDLLLDLVKTSKVNIHDISISKITKDYQVVIDALKQMNIGLSADFLVMASFLILLKTRELLPQDEREDLNDNFYGQEIDGNAFIEQLFHYEKFRRAAQVLSEKSAEDIEFLDSQKKGDHRGILPYLEEDGSFIRVSVSYLMESFVKISKERKWDEELQLKMKRKEQISISKKMVEIKEKLSKKKRLSLVGLIENDLVNSDRFLCLGYFFAILELYRKQEIFAWQKKRFGNIFLENASS